MSHTTIPTTEGSLFVVEEGEGPAVVFVHGTPSSSFEFRHVIRSLRDRCRCIAPDQLGFGRSDKPQDADYSVRGHQRRFALAMDALDVDDAIFVLHDFGTSFALAWMLANPDRVRGVVLANTFAWPVTGAFAWVARFYATRFGRWLYRLANVSAGLLLPWAWGSHRPLTPELHADYKAPFAARDQRFATSALPGELVGTTLAQLETQVSQIARWPVRAVWGMADPMVGVRELERWQAVLPGLEVDAVEKAGHFVSDEAPEAIERAVLRLRAQLNVTTATDRAPDAVGPAIVRDRAAAATG